MSAVRLLISLQLLASDGFDDSFLPIYFSSVYLIRKLEMFF